MNLSGARNEAGEVGVVPCGEAAFDAHGMLVTHRFTQFPWLLRQGASQNCNRAIVSLTVRRSASVTAKANGLTVRKGRRDRCSNRIISA
jgi:hypothetical protein